MIANKPKRRYFALDHSFGIVQDVPAIEIMRQMRYVDTSCCISVGGRLMPVNRKHVAGLAGFWRNPSTGVRPIDQDPNKRLRVCVLKGAPNYMEGVVDQNNGSHTITMMLFGD